MQKPIKEWHADERPREKMIAKGASALTNAELLAILISKGSKENRHWIWQEVYWTLPIMT